MAGSRRTTAWEGVPGGLHPDATPDEQEPLTKALDEGLRELGYVEGRNIVFERRFAWGKQERLPDLAAELVRLNVDVIVTGANPAIAAVKQATAMIPDSGRIRNELQTMIPQALEHDGDRIRVHFERINEMVLPRDKQARIRNVLHWYKVNHPVWFDWLELV